MEEQHPLEPARQRWLQSRSYHAYATDITPAELPRRLRLGEVSALNGFPGTRWHHKSALQLGTRE